MVAQGCQYKVWNGGAIVCCGKETEDRVWISYIYSPDERGVTVGLCSEHMAFALDSKNIEIVQTSEGLMHVRSIKEMFKDSSRVKKKKCPKCGHIF